MAFISAIAHVNLSVPRGTLDLSERFYADTLGMIRVPVPEGREEILAWYNIPGSGTPPQQIHIAFPANEKDTNEPTSARHVCFKIGSEEKLEELKRRVWEHNQRGGDGAPLQADEPGQEASGMKGKEFMPRFFARDYAGNRLEFSV